jgi:hypothetical protein
MKRLATGLFLAVLLAVSISSTASAKFGIEDFSVESSTSQAGAHPDFTTTIRFPYLSQNGGIFAAADGNVRNISVELPPGLLGNPSAVPQCPQQLFVTKQCPIESEVGVSYSRLNLGPEESFVFTLEEPVFNMEPRNPDTTAELAFYPVFVTVHLVISARTDGNYGLNTEVIGAQDPVAFLGTKIKLWGVPGDASHESERLDPATNFGGIPAAPGPYPRIPFFTNPTSCGPMPAHAAVNSYQESSIYHEADASLPATTGCDQLDFDPGIEARPTTNNADSPSGLDVDIDMPQHDSLVGHVERQKVTVDATQGQFKLSFEGQTTPDLPYAASAEEVQNALEGLGTIGSGNVAVYGKPSIVEEETPSGVEQKVVGAKYAVAFQGSLAHTDLEQITAASGTEPLQLVIEGETITGSATVETAEDGSPLGSVGEESATAHLRDASVTLPEGLTVNPSSANGLASCSPEQIGMTTAVGDAHPHFSKAAAACPGASAIGTTEVITPSFPDALHGRVYLATPHQNPFGSLLALYATVKGHGLNIKLAGEVKADPKTGRLTTTFTENPQFPVEHFRLHLFKGALAPLKTPPGCGTYTTTSSLTPWSAPESGPPATPSDTYAINQAAGGRPCGQAQNSPSFEAGTVDTTAGSYTPFVLNLSRPDGSQGFGEISATLPPGLLAKLAGTPPCSEADLAAAANKSGTAEQAAPSCPAASRIGSVAVAAGAGPQPFHASGQVYLSGPYKGAPLSLAIVTPAVAGPFDLGTVVVRNAVRIDPVTAQVSAVSDPIPSILQGIPLDIRSVSLRLDKPQFTRTPTSCDPMQVTGSLTSLLGQAASLADRFQVGDCPRLGFKPKLGLTLKGKVNRRAHPSLHATLTARPGDANIASAQVKLPPSVFLDQSHIGTVCTRVQFAAQACPAGSIYGKAQATSPLLDYPVAGPVYLRSSDHKLPDLVADLRGPVNQPIEVALAGKTDAVKGALRNTFEAVPDVPVTKFSLTLFGGKKGLIIMSDGFCAHPRATAKFGAQNGKVSNSTPKVAAKCGKPKKKKK